jgi:hypothetical protein
VKDFVSVKMEATIMFAFFFSFARNWKTSNSFQNSVLDLLD